MKSTRLPAATIALALAACASSSARADWSGALDGRSSIYQDTDRTFISTTVVSGRISPRDVFSVSGHYLADIITSASVDVVSAATGAFHEIRQEGNGAAVYADGTNTARLGYTYSVEHDWRSHSISGGYSRDFFNHILTVGLSGGFITNDIFRSWRRRTVGPNGEIVTANEDLSAHDPNFQKKQLQGSGSLDIGLVASKRDLVTFNYTFMYLSGYQASPYRYVFVFDQNLAGSCFYYPASTNGCYAVPETVPEVRVRHAGAIRWNRHVLSDAAIKTFLRFYGDDWGVLALTGGTEAVFGLPKGFEIGASVRGYVQKGATFYKDGYKTPLKYMTADRELSPFFDAFGSLRVGWAKEHVGPFELHAEVKGTAFLFQFFDFARLPHRYGLVGEISLGGSL